MTIFFNEFPKKGKRLNFYYGGHSCDIFLNNLLVKEEKRPGSEFF